MISQAHIWPAVLPGALSGGRAGGGTLDGQRARPWGCRDSFLRHTRPPSLPEVLDLISRFGIRKEFSTSVWQEPQRFLLFSVSWSGKHLGISITHDCTSHEHQ